MDPAALENVAALTLGVQESSSGLQGNVRFHNGLFAVGPEVADLAAAAEGRNLAGSCILRRHLVANVDSHTCCTFQSQVGRKWSVWAAEKQVLGEEVQY